MLAATTMPAGAGTSTPKNSDVCEFSLNQIELASENDLIYDNFGIANVDDAELVCSISTHGIQEPLAVSQDGVLLSGHRRYAAATYIGRQTVPVRVIDLEFKVLNETDRIATLRRFNQQREKSPGERIREKLIDIDPNEARSALVTRRRKAREVALTPSNVELGKVKKRHKIMTLQYLNAVKKVVQENKPYWPMTDRRVHYLLLNDPPLRHDKKPNSTYINDLNCYKATTNLLLRARLTGDVPWEAIEDETRPILLSEGFPNLEDFIVSEMDDFLMRYGRNLMQGQPHHIEILLEKNALKTVIQEVAKEFCIPLTVGKGFSSIPPRYDLAKRFKQSGKDTLVLLLLTDFDPDGETIAASFARSLRDDFGIEKIHAKKVALTAEDVRDNNLPSDLDAKASSPNYEKFIAKHGMKVVELDACPVWLLQSKLRDAINSYLDIDEFNAQFELEKQDAANIEAHRRVAFAAIKGAAA